MAIEKDFVVRNDLNVGGQIKIANTVVVSNTGSLSTNTGYFSGQLTIDGFTNHAGLSFRSGFDPSNVGVRAKPITTTNYDGLEILGYNGIDFTINNGSNVALHINGEQSANPAYIGIGTSSPQAALHIAGTGYATSDFRAPIFYDSNNTWYYVKPSGLSNLAQVELTYQGGGTNTNTLQIGATSDFGPNNFELGIALPSGGTHWPFGFTKGGSVYASIDTNGNQVLNGTITASNLLGGYQVLSFDAAKAPGLYQYDGAFTGTQPSPSSGNWRTVEIGSDQRFTQIALPWNRDDMYYRRQTGTSWSNWMHVLYDGFSTATLYSPHIDIFYDTNNTAYYVDPSNGSYIIGSRGYAGEPITTPDNSIAHALRAGGYIEWQTDVGAIGTSYFNSDISLKTNILPSTKNSSDIFRQINFVEFDWLPNSGQTGHNDVGFIAQEIEKIDAKLVNTLSNGIKSINEPYLATNLAKSIQEILIELENIKTRLSKAGL